MSGLRLLHSRLLGLQALMISAACRQDGSPTEVAQVIPAFVLDFSAGQRLLNATSDAEAEAQISGDFAWLRIRNDVGVQEFGQDGGLAVLAYTGNSSNDWRNPRPCPPGLYYRQLDAKEIERLHHAVRWSMWWLQPPLRGRRHGYPIFGVAYSSADGFTISREINFSDGPFSESAEQLYRRLETLEESLVSGTFQATSAPSATLEFQVWAERSSADDPSRYVLWVQFQNHGTHPVVFADPRVRRTLEPARRDYPYILQYDDEDPFAPLHIEVARLDERGLPWVDEKGYPWVMTVPLSPPACGDSMSVLPHNVVLDAQSTFVVEVPWVVTMTEPGRYRLYVKWKDFWGPIAPVDGQLSFMPLPRQGSASLDTGPYPVRGAYIASHIIEVPER